MRTALWPKKSRHGRSRPPMPRRTGTSGASVSGGGLPPPGKRHGEKLEYATPEEAEQAARGYLEGTMEPDGFAYEGAAVYDLLEKKWFRVIGDFPTPEPPAAKEEQPPPPREDTEPAAADRDLLGKEITLEGRRFRVEKIDEDGRASLRDLTFEGAADFPIERVEHISAIQRLMEPAEKTAGPERA